MKEDSIITLDNNLEYAILEKVTIDNKNYYYAALVKEEVPTGEYIFLEEIKKEEKLFVKKITDEQLIKKLVTIVAKDYINTVKSLEK